MSAILFFLLFIVVICGPILLTYWIIIRGRIIAEEKRVGLIKGVGK